MKALITLACLSLSLNAMAAAKMLTSEQLVAAVLTSGDLKAEKAANTALAGKKLVSVDVEQTKDSKELTVYLTYKPLKGGAPCTVKAVVAPKNLYSAVGGGKQIAEIKSFGSVCAMN